MRRRSRRVLTRVPFRCSFYYTLRTLTTTLPGTVHQKVFRIRWFTPTVEVDLCGHATLAATHALYAQGLVEAGECVLFLTQFKGEHCLQCHSQTMMMMMMMVMLMSILTSVFSASCSFNSYTPHFPSPSPSFHYTSLRFTTSLLPIHLPSH